MLRDVVEATLVSLGYEGPEASRDLVQRRDALAREAREMEGQISWLERVAFFRATPDDARLREVKAELAAVEREIAERAERDRSALVRVGADVPPLRFAQRLGEAYQRFTQSLRQLNDADLVSIATVLDALAEDVRVTYLSDVDVERAIDELEQRSREGDPSAAPPTKPEVHPQWGWAPVEQARLVAIAASSLDDAAVDALRARLEAERAELEVVEASVRAAQDRRGFSERIFGDDPALAQMKLALEKEEWDVFLATETHRLALLGALQAYPPMRVYLAATAAAATLTGTAVCEHQVLWPGTLGVRGTGHLGFVATAVTELVHATEAAFPGASGYAGITVVVPRATAQKALTPYRAGPAAEPASPPMHGSAAEAQLFEALDKLGVSGWLARGVAHAAAGATLQAKGAAERPSLASKLAIWSGGGSTRIAEDLERRGRWHTWAASTFAGRLWGTPSEVGAGQFEIALRDGIVGLHLALSHVATGGYEGDHQWFANRFVAPAVVAVDRASAVVGSGIGLSGTRYALAEAARVFIESYPPSVPPYRPGDPPRLLAWPEVVATVAEPLRAMGFGPAYDRLKAAYTEYETVGALGAQAAREVPFMDVLNIFVESEAEQRRDQLLGRARELSTFILEQTKALEIMLDQALLAYPPASVFHGLEVVRKHVAAIQLEFYHTRSGRVVQHIGLDAARWALAGWTRSAYSLFPIAPSNGILLARYALRSLAG